MARPKSRQPRDRQINIALTGDEHAALNLRADAAGLRLIDFARALLLRERVAVEGVAVTPSRLDRLMHEEMKRIGNNVNQIARKLNALAIVSPPDLEAALAELRILINRFAQHGA